MDYFVYITKEKNIEDILKKYKEGTVITLNHKWTLEKESTIFFYFDSENRPGIYCVSNVIESFAVEKDIAISKVEILRCDNYPFVKKEEMKLDTRFFGLREISKNEAEEYFLMMDRWEPYAENNMLSIEQVAYRIGSSVQTINNWYRFRKMNEDDIYAKMLPDFYQLNPRQKRYWPKESIKDLLLFKNSIPKGRNGVLGDATQKYIRDREISAEVRYINEIINNLKKRNVSNETIDKINKLLLNDARQRGLTI